MPGKKSCEETIMYAVQRAIAIVKPKLPFLEWLENLPDADLDISIDQLRTDGTAYLIPEFTELEDALAAIDDLYPRMFEMELFNWCEEQQLWPANRTIKLFWEWFDVDLHSTVVDLVEDD